MSKITWVDAMKESFRASGELSRKMIKSTKF